MDLRYRRIQAVIGKNRNPDDIAIFHRHPDIRGDPFGKSKRVGIGMVIHQGRVRIVIAIGGIVVRGQLRPAVRIRSPGDLR